MAPAENWRFNAATIFLTYPRCDLSRETLLEELHKIFDIKDYVIAQELHQDGYPHLHAFLKLERKINKRTSDFADLLGFHPNIAAPRSIKAVILYVEKVCGFVVYTTNLIIGWQLHRFRRNQRLSKEEILWNYRQTIQIKKGILRQCT